MTLPPGTSLSTAFSSGTGATATAISTSPGWLFGLEVSNSNDEDGFVQLFDLATGDVTVGTTTPKLSLFVPAAQGAKRGGMDKFWIPYGLAFNLAITYACTTTATGNTAHTTGLVVNAMYK